MKMDRFFKSGKVWLSVQHDNNDLLRRFKRPQLLLPPRYVGGGLRVLAMRGQLVMEGQLDYVGCKVWLRVRGGKCCFMKGTAERGVTKRF